MAEALNHGNKGKDTFFSHVVPVHSSIAIEMGMLHEVRPSNEDAIRAALQRCSRISRDFMARREADISR